MGLPASEIKEGKGGRPKKREIRTRSPSGIPYGLDKGPDHEEGHLVVHQVQLFPIKDKMRRHILRKHIEGGKAIALQKFCQSPKDPTKTIPRFNQSVLTN